MDIQTEHTPAKWQRSAPGSEYITGEDSLVMLSTTSPRLWTGQEGARITRTISGLRSDSPSSTIYTSYAQQRVYYLSTYALPLQRNHQQRKPTRPPTTAITATEIPAMAPVERPLLFVFPPGLSPFMR